MGCGGSKPAQVADAGEPIQLSEQQFGEGKDGRNETPSRASRAKKFLGDGIHNVATGMGELGVGGKYGGVGPTAS